MPILPWSAVFSVGVEEIDQQHRTLVAILNRLGDADPKAADVVALQNRILDELTDYTVRHFATEERLMSEHAYLRTVEHTGEHQQLVKRVLAMHARRAQGETLPFDELLVFLRDWLTQHIMGSDKALGRALNAKGVH